MIVLPEYEQRPHMPMTHLHNEEIHTLKLLSLIILRPRI